MSDERAKKIKMMLFDVDGVMTDGTIFLFPAPGAGAGQETHERRQQMADKGGFGFAGQKMIEAKGFNTAFTLTPTVGLCQPSGRRRNCGSILLVGISAAQYRMLS